ncbi:MAG: SDR family NAD(P)-dependent oxidoreductase, partial [Proteobacteria bacterium]
MPSANRFTNKTVIITGGASGIGLATAKRFGQEGARVVLADLSEAKLASAEKELRLSGVKDVLGVRCNVAESEDIKQTVAQAIETFG